MDVPGPHGPFPANIAGRVGDAHRLVRFYIEMTHQRTGLMFKTRDDARVERYAKETPGSLTVRDSHGRLIALYAPTPGWTHATAA